MMRCPAAQTTAERGSLPGPVGYARGDLAARRRLEGAARRAGEGGPGTSDMQQPTRFNQLCGKRMEDKLR